MPKSLPPIPDDLDGEPNDRLDRLFSLSDGIYAFAMTLLAVNVDLPQLAQSASAAEVTTAVLALGPQLFIFISSFLLVGLYWQVARRIFRWIVREDGLLTWLTLFQLMFVAFLPVSTGLFDTHPTVPIVVVIYAGTLLGVGVLGQLIWVHARRANLFDEKLNPHLIRYYTFRGYITIAIYSLLILAGIFDPVNARLVLLLMLVYPFLSQVYRLYHQVRYPASTSQK